MTGSQKVEGPNPSSSTKSKRALDSQNSFEEVASSSSQHSNIVVSLPHEEFKLTTLSDALNAYKICAQAENRSPETISWICHIVGYFSKFLEDCAKREGLVE